ncbi:hypothetical protein D5F01_LYC11049 [Larimichthys crocea]|uniref:Uncharacterized protein n=1 Tax=Larimichthys crocea TaxID=215358 RepID=A0A6G0IJ87_LARCR|nr:hypothetical protein D5F01_LYC11049 [Larimichthys crocea]
MALTFLAYHSEGSQFNTANLDRVLEMGDSLYVGIKNQLLLEDRYVQDHLTVEEMPQQVVTDNNVYEVRMSLIRCGHLKAQEGNPVGFLPLDAQLQALSTDVTHAILIVTPECIAVFSDRSGRYGVFDSHSRNARGLPYPDGTAIMLTFGHLSDLINHLHKLFNERGTHATYEFVPISFHSVDNPIECHGQPDDVEKSPPAVHPPEICVKKQLTESNMEVPQLKTMARTQETKSDDTTDVPQRQDDVEVQDEVQKLSKLSKQQRRKVLRRTRSTKTETTSRNEYEKNKYAHCSDIRMKRLKAMKTKYARDSRHRQQKLLSAAGPCLRAKKRLYSLRRYMTDLDFQTQRKKYMAQRYERSDVRQKRKAYGTSRIKKKYRRTVISCHQTPMPQDQPQPVINAVMEAAISSFREKTKQGPTYVCTVCHRTLFPNQVMRCNRTKYIKNIDVASACLTGKYVHVCDMGCSSPCTMPHERMQEWICYSCDDHLRRGNLPSIAVANKLELAPIPSELAELNVLERQLIAKILPFAKIVALPKGQQRAVHGAVVCVPSEVEATVNCLPRPSSDAQLLQVKLKRRIKYKGHQYFFTVNMKNVLTGLATLKDIHSEYKDVSIDETATFDSLPDDLPCDEEHTQQDNGDASEQADQSQNPEKDELRPGLVLDSCMQPPDIAQEVLSYGNGIFSVAPAQGNKPVGFFAISKLEAMAFPVQFPTGQNTLDEPIGEVEDYFYRVEFQARGSPHIHLLVWIKDAPEFGDLQDDSVVIKFIDQYITCQMPDPNADPELHKIVSEVQVHSRNHSKSCRKPEHEMTEFLNDVIRDVKKTNVNEKDEMKQIMQAYAKHREVSAQEAVARTCSLPLKKCSRNVVFIQTDDNALKMSLPMSRLKDVSPESEQVWMSGLPEKYAERPRNPEYEGLCLAEFASRYRTVYGQQSKGKNAVPF